MAAKLWNCKITLKIDQYGQRHVIVKKLDFPAKLAVFRSKSEIQIFSFIARRYLIVWQKCVEKKYRGRKFVDI